MKEKKTGKIQKNVELVSALASFFDSEMDVGDKIRMTPLAKKITFQSGKNPHVDTVRTKCTELAVLKDVVNSLKFHFKDGKLLEIEKVQAERFEIEQRRLMQRDILEMRSRLDSIEDKFNKLISTIEHAQIKKREP